MLLNTNICTRSTKQDIMYGLTREPGAVFIWQIPSDTKHFTRCTSIYLNKNSEKIQLTNKKIINCSVRHPQIKYIFNFSDQIPKKIYAKN